MYLAAHVAHTTDVDAMLATMTPADFDEWMAVLRVWGVLGTSDESKPDSLSVFRNMTGL